MADRAKEKIKEKVTDKVERSVDNAMDNVLKGKKMSKKSRSNSEEYGDYSEDTSSADYEESSYEESNNDASNESGNISQLILTDMCVMTGMTEEGVQQIALITESQERILNELYETFEDKFTGNLQEQMLKRKLDENNEVVLKEFIKKY